MALEKCEVGVTFSWHTKIITAQLCLFFLLFQELFLFCTFLNNILFSSHLKTQVGFLLEVYCNFSPIIRQLRNGCFFLAKFRYFIIIINSCEIMFRLIVLYNVIVPVQSDIAKVIQLINQQYHILVLIRLQALTSEGKKFCYNFFQCFTWQLFSSYSFAFFLVFQNLCRLAILRGSCQSKGVAFCVMLCVSLRTFVLWFIQILQIFFRIVPFDLIMIQYGSNMFSFFSKNLFAGKNFLGLFIKIQNTTVLLLRCAIS
eukprot:TRINITY_DN17188_c0_g1_i1.p3 TRINITY_DN17188_c0_g1~~TRINITY_DN17188_c0_g1_i1.p3  ORF type:complete len:257 (-),score=-15.10 TRINITY_DN17188_c0_g1_i1:1559-2329(-)